MLKEVSSLHFLFVRTDFLSVLNFTYTVIEAVFWIQAKPFRSVKCTKTPLQVKYRPQTFQFFNCFRK